MIELNCSYEESKKILELGYDFSSACTKFELKTDMEYKVVYGRIAKRNDRTEIESSETMEGDGRVVHLRSRFMLDPLMVSIIPKAALEACLPTSGDGIGDEKSSFYWYKQLQGGDCHERISYVFNFDHFGDYSIFEAFLWCHENYPEELEKKFDEVMK